MSARLLGVALAVCLPLVAATPAAACGELRHASASGHAGAGRAPLVIGDSTLILAAPVLGSLGLEADARGCRQFAEGIGMLAARRRAGRLPGVVVLALGANGAIGTSAIAAALRVTGPERVLAVVTPRNLGSSAGAMRAAAARHPDRVLLVDWARASAGHGGWFAGDGLHVTYAGARIYARFIRRALAPVGFPPVRRLSLPRTTRGARPCGTVRASGRRVRVFVVRGAVACGAARRLARRPLLHPSPGWNCFDWRHAGAGPWRSVLKRPRHPEVLATTA